MNTKICTSKEQSKKLIELGIDIYTADMYWKNGVSDKYIQCFTPFACGDYQDGLDFDYDIPAWSLTALLDILPLEIDMHTQSDGNIKYYYIEYTTKKTYFASIRYNNPLDAAFEIVCWLLEKKKLL